MALNAAAVWEIRTTGNDANGGAFRAGGTGTDYSIQDSPQVTIDGATITATVHTATTQLNIVGYTVSAVDVNNHVNIAGGTMTAGTYEITAVDIPNNRWTIDRAGGTATQTGTGRMGGAKLTPGSVAPLIVAGNSIYQKAGTYPITSASTNIAGGCVTLTARLYWEGYQNTRGDMGTKPLWQASAISTAVILTHTLDAIYVNLSIDGAGLTSISGFSSSGRSSFIKCVAMNCTNTGFTGSGTSTLYDRCRSTANTTAGSGFLNGIAFGCVADANTVAGFTSTNCINCIAYANSGASTDGFTTAANNVQWINCTAYGNGRDGFASGATVALRWFNCIAEGNTQYGYNGSTNPKTLINCAAYNNTAGPTNGTFVVTLGFITGTASFFVNAAAGNFALNTNAGGGAVLRAAGVMGVFPDAISTGYQDVGAVQHIDPPSNVFVLNE